MLGGKGEKLAEPAVADAKFQTQAVLPWSSHPEPPCRPFPMWSGTERDSRALSEDLQGQN